MAPLSLTLQTFVASLEPVPNVHPAGYCICCVASLSSYARPSWASPCSSEADSALCSRYSPPWSPAATVYFGWSCRLHRRWLGWLSRHPQVHLGLCCVFWRQSCLLVLQAPEHGVKIQCWSRVSRGGQWSCWGHLATPASSRAACPSPACHIGVLRQHQCRLHDLQPDTASANQAHWDWSSLRPGASRHWWSSCSACSHFFTICGYLHQRAAFFSVHGVQVQSKRAEWLTIRLQGRVRIDALWAGHGPDAQAYRLGCL